MQEARTSYEQALALLATTPDRPLNGSALGRDSPHLDKISSRKYTYGSDTMGTFPKRISSKTSRLQEIKETACQRMERWQCCPVLSMTACHMLSKCVFLFGGNNHSFERKEVRDV